MSEAVVLVAVVCWRNYKHLSHSVRLAMVAFSAGYTEDLGFQEAEIISLNKYSKLFYNLYISLLVLWQIDFAVAPLFRKIGRS